MYFQRAISCSSQIGIKWFEEKQAIEFGKIITKNLGCPTDDIEKSLDCLRKLHLVEFMSGCWGSKLLQSGPWHESLRYQLFSQMSQPFGPVMDGHFINDQLYGSIKSNKISKPIIFENAIQDAEKMVEIGFGAIRESMLLGHDESSLGKFIEK